MRVFLYEFVTGGGALAAGLPLGGSLLCEGRAMIAALADDFGQLDGIQVHLLRDTRLPDLSLPSAEVHSVRDADEHGRQFEQLTRQSDWTLVVAPEMGGFLLRCCRQVLSYGGRLLSPDADFVEIASDKGATHCLLQKAGVPVPVQQLLRPGQELPRQFRYPAIVKPREGAGSFQVRMVQGCNDQAGLSDGANWRCLESYCAGIPASVSILTGPSGFRTLPASRQRLSEDGCFRYAGGDLPIRSELERRASEIARQVVSALPETTGYFGIDIVLGDRQNGCFDVAIEVNPRITTSYIGLRQLAKSNLAAAMLACVTGRPYELSFASQRVEFSAE